MTFLSGSDLIPDRALADGDPDAFNHEAIAGRVAELVVHAPTPANIALFGAWGSGKSSFFELLRRALQEKWGGKVALVRYDAWKFGGESLKRNFISHVATQLGLDDGDSQNRAFHVGLYESSRSVDLNFGRYLKGETRRVVAAAAITVLVTLVVVVALATVVGLLSGQPVWPVVQAWIRAWGGAAAGALGALVAALKLLDIAKVQVEQTAPSADEQFARTFTSLIEAARRRGAAGTVDRLVFFIDELDRCSKDDVVETLAALRTFLDIRGCVFIVVADRDVLEEALTELPQSTPTNEVSPYYSSSSAFLDKIFQFQIALPPLRIGRLTGYARDLVTARGGLWEDLSASTVETLNAVLYTLIPAHVRSPRRVKVLLNRFATNARVAQARGLEWQARAAEIAKLTVLQTEFPHFAEAMVTEPRLPEYVLSGEAPEPLPTRSAGVIRKFVGARREHEFQEEGVSPEAPLDRMLSVSDHREELRRVQRRELVRYLERTVRVPHPGRDLLYLEAAGMAAGLDPAVGQALEDLAPDSPGRAAALVEELSDSSERRAALTFLVGMIEGDFGFERANEMEVALGVAIKLRDEMREGGQLLCNAIRAFLQEQTLGEEQLARALLVALFVGDQTLATTIMDDERLLVDPKRVRLVAESLPLLPEERREVVADRIGELIPTGVKNLLGPLRTLPKELGGWLVARLADPVMQHVRAVEGQEGEEGGMAVLEELSTLVGFELVTRVVVWKLLVETTVGSGYSFVLNHAEDLSDLSDQLRNSVVLRCLMVGPVEDWPTWEPLVAETDTDWDQQGERALEVLERLVQQFSELDAAGSESALAIAAKVLPITRSVDNQAASRLKEALQGTLGEQNWWANPQLYKEQSSLHLLTAAMTGGGEETQATIEAMVESDLARGLASLGRVSALSLDGVRDLSSWLPGKAQGRLLDRVEALVDDLPPDLAADAALTRLTLWSRLDEDEREEHEPIGPDDVIAAMGDHSRNRLAALGAWLDTGPRVQECVAVAARIPPRAARESARLFGEWSAGLSDDERTQFLQALWREGRTEASWTIQLRQQGLDEVALVETLSAEIAEAPRAEEREERIDRLLALAPQNPKVQYRVGDLIIGLLETGLKVDAKLALRGAPALGDNHRSKGRIESALRKASDRLGLTITSAEAKQLRAVGITAPRRSFSERAWAFLTGDSE